MTVSEPEIKAQDEHPANWVPIKEQPLFTPKKLKIICAGAGYSGLMLAYKIQNELKCEDLIELQIYEKNAEVGGTWLENKYAGAACDVPAHIYTFMFEPNPDWSSFYVGSDEILGYIQRTAAKYKLAKNVSLKSKIVSTVWNEEKGKWEVTVEKDGKTFVDEAEILVDGSGILNKWEYPNIPGLKDFKGHIVHTASWDRSYSYKDKRVAVIGNGSSAIQIVPQIAKEASYLANLIRNPTWVSVNYAAHLTPEGKNFKYTDEEKKRFKEDKKYFTEYRHQIEHEFNKFFYALFKESPEQQAVKVSFTDIMRQRLGNDEYLISKLIPDWQVGCRRLTPGDGYLEALTQEHVEPIFTAIKRITETGLELVDGRNIELDAIICATGFNVKYLPKWELTGKNGYKISEAWKDYPEAYFSMCALNTPNYFIVNGPNCPIGHGSLLSVMKWTIDYIVRWAQKIASEDIKSITVKEKPLKDYNVYTQEFLKRTVWSSGCHSWYKSSEADENRVVAMYAGSILHYKEVLESFRAEDFDIEYSSPNSFSFMGNGLVKVEVEGGDLAQYIF